MRGAWERMDLRAARRSSSTMRWRRRPSLGIEDDAAVRGGGPVDKGIKVVIPRRFRQG